ncbi:hypothetical protein RHMOL_Rhmol05G0236800 [Rhododendron molle]|uniref:Uncharacterized protein n=1 Tax=Rhododendron molle TaxID=49168 RepID=A0ACC0NUS9_RHOML|nr:hypothetical protein RHMOL_Rhmol05G0236800 [Rhododendron molle]
MKGSHFYPANQYIPPFQIRLDCNFAISRDPNPDRQSRSEVESKWAQFSLRFKGARRKTHLNAQALLISKLIWESESLFLSLSKKRSTTQASHIRRPTGAPKYAGPPPPVPPSVDQPTTTDAAPRLAPRFSRLPPTHHTSMISSLLSLLHLTHSPLVAPPPTGNPKPATTTTTTTTTTISSLSQYMFRHC